MGGGPRVVVRTTAFHAFTSSGFVSRSRGFERNNNVSSPSTRKTVLLGSSVTARPIYAKKWPNAHFISFVGDFF